MIFLIVFHSIYCLSNYNFSFYFIDYIYQDSLDYSDCCFRIWISYHKNSMNFLRLFARDCWMTDFFIQYLPHPFSTIFPGFIHPVLFQIHFLIFHIHSYQYHFLIHSYCYHLLLYLKIIFTISIQSFFSNI